MLDSGYLGYPAFYAAAALVIIFWVIFGIISLIAYIIASLGLYKAAQKRNMPYPWMAWIPLLRDYLIGTMLKNELAVTPKLKIPYIQYILPAASILASFGGFFTWLFGIVYVVLAVLSLISLFRQYKEPNAVLYGILAGIPAVQIVGCFFIYKLGAKDPPDPAADQTVFPTA